MSAQAVRLSNVDIDNALKSNDFEVLFQPIFDLSNGALARVETFVRWRHASLGVLPPGAFISFFESQGRMSELTRYVLGEALARYNEWRGPYPPGFSINLALSDLGDPSFVSHFSVLLREHKFPADLITLECPMPPVDQDVAQASENFARLAETGARLAIEVRGRTNELLRKLDPFPFDEIKTGGAAILRFARTVRGPGLSAISELLELAEEANAVITAVGVEDQASLSALRSIGFAAAQGNHLGRVGALEDFKPSQVNTVRDLLELPPLAREDLNAMFRTSVTAARTDAAAPSGDQPSAETPPAEQSASNGGAAPETKAAAQTPKRAPARKARRRPPAADAPDGLPDGLIERLAARIADNEAAGGAQTGPVDITEVSENKRRAAAIARARQKASQKTQPRYKPVATLRGDAEAPEKETPADSADLSIAPASDPEIDARDLQARLTEEFPPEATDGKAATADAAATGDTAATPGATDLADDHQPKDQKTGAEPAPSVADVGADANTDADAEFDAGASAAQNADTEDTASDGAQDETQDDTQGDAQGETQSGAQEDAERDSPQDAADKQEQVAASDVSDDAPGTDAPGTDAPGTDAPEIDASPATASAEVDEPQETPAPDQTEAQGAVAMAASADANTAGSDAASSDTEESDKEEIDLADRDKASDGAPATARLSLGALPARALNVVSVRAASAAPTPAPSPPGAAPMRPAAKMNDFGDALTAKAPQGGVVIADPADVVGAPAQNAARPAIDEEPAQDLDLAPEALNDLDEALDIEAGMLENALDVTDAPNDDIDDDIQGASEALAPRRRRKKNFLMRKYQLPKWPTHFWPRSWKRAWRRREAYKAAIRRERAESTVIVD